MPRWPASTTAERLDLEWSRRAPPVVWENAPGNGPVFDPASGETLFLSDLPAVLLAAIDAQPVGLALLVERIAGPLELDTPDRGKILTALLYLENAELVESSVPTAD